MNLIDYIISPFYTHCTTFFAFMQITNKKLYNFPQLVFLSCFLEVPHIILPTIGCYFPPLLLILTQTISSTGNG